MSKRFVRISIFALALILGGAFTARPSSAQQAEPAKQPVIYTYVALFGVAHAQFAEYEKSLATRRKAFDGLVADGTIVSYGIGAIEVHTGIKDETHASWWSSTTVAGLMKTLEALRAIGASPSDIEFTMHSDQITMSRLYNGKGGNSGGYLLVQDWKVKPGRGDEFTELFNKYRRADLDALVSNGSITGYSVQDTLIHTSAPGTMTLVVSFPNAEGLDKYYASIEELHTKNPLFGEVFGGVNEGAEHRDFLLHILFAGGK